MSWNQWARQSHRWLSIAFTAAVLVNLAAWRQEEPAAWVGLLALLPLTLLLFTGLYLFVLPYTARWRSRRRAGGRTSVSPAGPAEPPGVD